MDDYIKRSDAIYLANNSILLSIDANDIARIPAADVRENVRGQWIHHEDDWYGDFWECSNCLDEYTIIEGYMYYNFCPNCGAQMEVDQR